MEPRNRKLAEEEARKEKEARFRAALKESPSAGGVWLLCGPESYLSREYALRMRRHIIPDPDLAVFDYLRIAGTKKGGVRQDSEEENDSGEDGGALPLAFQIQQACATFPVMNEGKLVELTEIPFDSMSRRDFSQFCDALSEASESPAVTVLMQCTEDEFPVLSAEGKKAKWTEMRDALEKAGVCIVVFDQQEERNLIPWCERHFAAEGMTAERRVILSLIRRCGFSMSALDGEIRKLSRYAASHKRGTVTMEDVESVTAETEFTEDYAIQNAVRNRDPSALLKVSRSARIRREKAVVLSAQIAGIVSEIWRVSRLSEEGKTPAEIASVLRMKEYPVKLDLQAARLYPGGSLEAILNRCAETDVQLKSASVEEYVLLDRLICEFGSAGKGDGQ